jgi:hypothetical protein
LIAEMAAATREQAQGLEQINLREIPPNQLIPLDEGDFREF